MPKKRLLFVLNSLRVGGVEKSLLALLRALPSDIFDIDVGVVDAVGGFVDRLPANVRLVEIPELHSAARKVSGRFKAVKRCIRNGNIKDAVKIPYLYIKSKIARTLIPLYSAYIRPSDYSLGQYDVAVAFQGPNELIDYYVSRIVRAKKKFGWIHFDIDNFFVRHNTVLECYPCFDRVLIVSDHAKNVFDRHFPSLADKSEVLLNIIDKEENLKLAAQDVGFIPDVDKLNVVTVGRLAWIKAQDTTIEAANLLRDNGVSFHWYFIGDGPQRQQFEELVAKHGLSALITFVGATPNPYPYMKNCDVYVQPSRSEGFCIAIGEAKLFGVPIVATDFLGAREQLHDVPNAIIIPSPEPQLIADAVVRAAKLGNITPRNAGNPPQIDRLIALFS